MTATITPFPRAGRFANGTVVALCGGAGGAKLAHGLYSVLPPGALTVVVNTGDDFQHLGLRISPDLDTVLYTLGARGSQEHGWGRAGEMWNFMTALKEIDGETWLQIGDMDLAMHVARTHWLQWGKPLSAFTEHAAAKYGIAARVVPMSDDVVSTWVSTADGLMPFQHYSIKEHCQPVIKGVHFEGAAQARLAVQAQRALADARLKAIVICPSNPYLSIDPILTIPGVRTAIAEAGCPVVAVSPVLRGKSEGGPVAKIMQELGHAPVWFSVARHYQGLADGILVDDGDCAAAETLGATISVQTSAIAMKTQDERKRLAETVLAFAASLATARSDAGALAPADRGKT